MPSKDENPTAGKTARGRFAPGNKFGQGRPTGSRNKASTLALEFFESKAPELAARAFEMAMDGDSAMMRVVLAKLIPDRKEPLDVNVKTERAIDVTGMSFAQLELMEQSILALEAAEALGGPAAERGDDEGEER